MDDQLGERDVINPEDAEEGSGGSVVEFGGETIRDRLVNALRFELLGPEEPDEVLQQSPATRYSVGMLAPRGTRVDETEDDGTDSAGEGDEGGDTPPPLTFSLNPSSIGLSFVVDPDCSSLKIAASWGEYDKRERPEEVDLEEAPDITIDDDPDATAKKKKRKLYEWHRSDHQEEVEIASFGEGRSDPVTIGEGVHVEWMIRRVGDNPIVSVFLVNSREGPANRRPPDEMWIYQPKLVITSSGSPFLARQLPRTEPDPDPDVASADLIYRQRIEFATGHGVAAGWRSEQGDVARAEEVWTEVLPEREVGIVRPFEDDRYSGSLDMDVLAEAASGDEVDELLEPLLAAYEEWIAERANEAKAIQPPHRVIADLHLVLARESLDRMRSGLLLLRTRSEALEAFRFANAAMALQRRVSVRVLEKRRGRDIPDFPDIEARWRPFQIGFILQCLAGIADPLHADRQRADLLWFPTGGGKTEAYLGLTAFTLALRRLADDPQGLDTSAGTAVLMRYTLRLLTIQQFQRASALLCACDVLRRKDEEKWGSTPFTIGLWVGQSVTPNRYEDSCAALERLKKGEIVYEGSPYQIQFCPWCGEDIEPKFYFCDDDLERTLIKCPNPECAFSVRNSELGLPLLVVDQEIYRNPPSLLLATVDKFAQMAWNGRVQSLFGRVERYCPRHGFISAAEDHPNQHQETRGWPKAAVQADIARLAPPALVIQDELHLISGPLGTLVGIYETAIEGLCSREVDGKLIRPKVIASTATIRRARQQIQRLFNRSIDIFPPLGLDADNSFFAREDKERPGRLYVGIYAPGKSIKTTLVRAYASMLARAKVEHDAVSDADEDLKREADAFMTLVGYFTSLRELGGALRLIDDDVPARLRVLRRRGFGVTRLLYEVKELTSRARSSQISQTLQQLDRTFTNPEKGSYPIDVLLASNMLSVGVDIDRLSLMVMSAQPKTTAEYIQASSRVGRSIPGVVIEVYNWIRPRDTSHYERFIHYHDTFYRHVEATSVTPFSARARDRAIPGVLVSYVRQNDPQLAQEKDANRFDSQDPKVQQIIAAIRARALAVTESEDVARDTEAALRNLAGEWHRLRGEQDALVYTGRGLKKTDLNPVLLRPMEMEHGRGHWTASGSLREIEPEVDVVLLEEEVD